MPSPEEQARPIIDALLATVGASTQDSKHADIRAARGAAMCEYSLVRPVPHQRKKGELGVSAPWVAHEAPDELGTFQHRVRRTPPLVTEWSDFTNSDLPGSPPSANWISAPIGSER